jgi:hypothetical protein
MNYWENFEDWCALGQLASKEEDPAKLMALGSKLSQALDQQLSAPEEGPQLSPLGEGRVLRNEQSRGCNNAS